MQSEGLRAENRIRDLSEKKSVWLSLNRDVLYRATFMEYPAEPVFLPSNVTPENWNSEIRINVHC
jgi:hypothetical protein